MNDTSQAPKRRFTDRRQSGPPASRPPNNKKTRNTDFASQSYPDLPQTSRNAVSKPGQEGQQNSVTGDMNYPQRNDNKRNYSGDFGAHSNSGNGHQSFNQNHYYNPNRSSNYHRYNTQGNYSNKKFNNMNRGHNNNHSGYRSDYNKHNVSDSRSKEDHNYKTQQNHSSPNSYKRDNNNYNQNQNQNRNQNQTGNHNQNQSQNHTLSNDRKHIQSLRPGSQHNNHQVDSSVAVKQSYDSNIKAPIQTASRPNPLFERIGVVEKLNNPVDERNTANEQINHKEPQNAMNKSSEILEAHATPVTRGHTDYNSSTKKERHFRPSINPRIHYSTTHDALGFIASSNMPEPVVPLDELYDSSERPVQCIVQVGQGTYGKVYKEMDVKSKKLLAMKRLRSETQRDDGILPVTAAREIKLLQKLNHVNIIVLNEIVVEKQDVYVVFDYIEHDLAGLMLNSELTFSVPHIKSVMKQLLSALNYIHSCQIVHRDIKGSNILITAKGVVKLADFGLARFINPDKQARYTNRVITLWYRPPEILLGAEKYAYEVDIWGAGCLLVELFLRKTLFRGTDDVSQLLSIFGVLGQPSSWPEYEDMPWYPLIKSLPLAADSWTFKFPEVFAGENVGPSVYSLASRMLDMNPNTRLSAKEALESKFFSEDPSPEALDLDCTTEWHDWDAKQRLK
ncbi:cyclin-dependent serine/threonine protein kinase [Starmerella bacillaris]|uniref:Cyclin-dependent serine/threonine protein kinase n=1 Tax=Starmerella bacillaris TaxID=1247836 RepID=A0AAV5RG74_STABA|nr:cyclin-dependent serine/threonine protein kinase [Starmerella bacillaris]